MSSRFDELKAIGFKNLKGDERNEYQTLLAEESKKLEAEFTAPPIPNDEGMAEQKITFTKEGLMKMLEEIKKDAIAGVVKDRDTEWQPFVPGANRKFTATIKTYQKDSKSPKGLVVDWKRLRTDQDPETKKRNLDIYEVTILHNDGKTDTMEIEIKDFAMFNEHEVVEIVSIEERPMQMKQGEVKAARVDRDDLGNELVMSDVKTDRKVPLIVIKDDPIATIKRPNGQLLKIKVNRLNQ